MLIFLSVQRNMLFKDRKNMIKSGIYLIVCQENNRCYIGRADSVYSMLSKHFKLLKKNKHFNHELQTDFNLYGLEKFEGKFVEEVLDPIERRYMELKWFEKVENSYNGQILKILKDIEFKYKDLT